MKIKYALLDKFFGLTNKEIDLLLYIAHYQDDYGHIRGIYYKDVCGYCQMCKQTFYNALNSLQEKEIILFSRNQNDYDITILNNDFSYKESFREGYINISRKVFDKKDFNNLRAKEKVLLLYFMKLTHENAKSYQIKTENFYKKYGELLGVTKRVLRSYLHSLRKFFAIGLKDGKYFITYLARVFKEKRSISEVDQHLGHIVRTSCRRNKIKELSMVAVSDAITLLKQYRHEAREVGKNILDVFAKCITESKSLNGKYLNVLIRRELGLDGLPTITDAIESLSI